MRCSTHRLAPVLFASVGPHEYASFKLSDLFEFPLSSGEILWMGVLGFSMDR
jgi:hypothetical protein